jgi:putative transposase
VNDIKESGTYFEPDTEERLVDVVAYCINSNHFHLLLRENKENGIATFMKKICTGYAMYFNKKNERSGILFQGRFKSVHVDSNDLLLYVSAYINCNSEIHGIEKA